ncbi:uncharacterized protein UTRI_10238 [Ustilago trichophora]|uniref:Uncharacterized protein n=1 Tax=Ustilago trichophora TaxID=86804 RepID=A0A5C3EIE0_9BASI|nr:uncharacterized protein UTRI_10238 [Ustilago trichophora]
MPYLNSALSGDSFASCSSSKAVEASEPEAAKDQTANVHVAAAAAQTGPALEVEDAATAPVAQETGDVRVNDRVQVQEIEPATEPANEPVSETSNEQAKAPPQEPVAEQAPTQPAEEAPAQLAEASAPAQAQIPEADIGSDAAADVPLAAETPTGKVDPSVDLSGELYSKDATAEAFSSPTPVPASTELDQQTSTPAGTTKKKRGFRAAWGAIRELLQ